VPTGPNANVTQKLTIKIPQIARWYVAGVSIVKIAELLGMTPMGVQKIMESSEYKEYQAAVLNGHLSAMDRALAGKVEAIQQEARQAVPAALRCLVDAVTQRRDLKSAISAAKELLDRDPDRALPASKEEEPIAPGIPEAILNEAVDRGNKIVDSYIIAPKDKVN